MKALMMNRMVFVILGWIIFGCGCTNYNFDQRYQESIKQIAYYKNGIGLHKIEYNAITNYLNRATQKKDYQTPIIVSCAFQPRPIFTLWITWMGLTPEADGFVLSHNGNKFYYDIDPYHIRDNDFNAKIVLYYLCVINFMKAEKVPTFLLDQEEVQVALTKNKKIISNWQRIIYYNFKSNRPE